MATVERLSRASLATRDARACDARRGARERRDARVRETTAGDVE
jgi:hypothetical protein